MAGPEIELHVESLYGARSDAPLVKLVVGRQEIIMPPEKARTVAQWLLDAAEAAYSDAFIIRWVCQATNVTREQARPLLREFRQFKELARRQGQEQEEADIAKWRKDHPDHD